MKKAKDLTIGIVGAGNMGSGIAQKYATEGFNVVIFDKSKKMLKIGEQSINNILKEGQKRKIFNLDEIAAIKNRLIFSYNKQDLSQVDLIIEAIFENKQIKQKLFYELDSICNEKTIFASNTSSFLISELAHATNKNRQFIGLHYFYHPAKNKLVEVIKTQQCNQDSYNFVWEIQEMCSKIPVNSKDFPGFIINRFFVPWLNESMRLVEDGIANIATVEEAAKKAFSIKMGPFQLMNITGPSITYHAANSLFKSLGNFYKPCELILPIIKEKTQWNIVGKIDKNIFKKIADRLLGVVFYLVNQIVFEEKICSLGDCDLSTRVGLRWENGPFEMINNIGIDKTRILVENINKKYFNIKTENIFKLQKGKNTPFILEFIKSKIKNNIGILIFNKPDTLNALSKNIINELKIKFTMFEKDSNIKGIIITATGKTFVAGADIKFFIQKIKNNDIDSIVNFATITQELFWQIDQCKKTVVCCMNGMALGGGLELSLACDKIITNEKTIMGFPETSIGIYPGLGGTQRTPRRIGKSLARWLILTGDLINAKIAKEIGLIDEMLPSAELLDRALILADTNKKDIIKIEKLNFNNELINLFNKDFESLKNTVSNNKFLAKLLVKFSQNAPLAQKVADKLIKFSTNNSLKKGLDMETKWLKNIFSTKDAAKGLSSIGIDKANFKGK